MGGDKLTWTNGTRKLKDLVPWELNARRIDEEQAARLVLSLEKFGQPQPICIEPDGGIVDGHQRQAVWAACQRLGPEMEVDVRVASRKLTDREKQELSVYLHKGAHGEWDWGLLAAWDIDDDLNEWGFSEWELGGDESEVPSLDELEDEYGEESDERDFWPYIKVQVSPETKDLWDSLLDQTGIEDEALAAEKVIGAVDASLFGVGAS